MGILPQGNLTGREPFVTLTELLENKFRADLRFRGETYVKAERVSLIRITPDQVFGIVQDSVEYETQLSRDDSQLKMYCTCEAVSAVWRVQASVGDDCGGAGSGPRRGRGPSGAHSALCRRHGTQFPRRRLLGR